MNLGKALLQAAHQVEKVLQRQIGMESANNVELRHRLGVARGRRLPRLFQSHRVARRVALLASEGAQPAIRHADVGGVDVAIDVEVGHIAVHPLAHTVGQPAHGQHVRGAVEYESVVEAQPFTVHHLGGNVLQPRVVRAKGCGMGGSASLALHTPMIQK